MCDHDIIEQIQTAETARIDEVMRQTSPSAVLRRLENAELEYTAYVSGSNYWTLKQTHGKNGIPALTAVIGLALALLLIGCDGTGLTVEQTTDAPHDVPWAIAPQPAPVAPPPPVPPCFDRDLGTIAPCAGRTDCTVSSTVTERTMCQAGGVVYVPSCETCTGVW